MTTVQTATELEKILMPMDADLSAIVQSIASTNAFPISGHRTWVSATYTGFRRLDEHNAVVASIDGRRSDGLPTKLSFGVVTGLTPSESVKCAHEQFRVALAIFESHRNCGCRMVGYQPLPCTDGKIAEYPMVVMCNQHRPGGGVLS